MTVHGPEERPRHPDPPDDPGAGARGEPLARLEERLDVLHRNVDDLRRRVERLETPRSAAAVAASPPGPLPGSPPARLGALSAGDQLALIGRTLLIIGGGFLLRALTDSGTVPVALGVVLGLAYAGFWVLQAHRVGDRSPASAAYHAVAAALLGYPILWEALTRFDLLAPWAAAGGMALLTVPLLAVGRRHDSPAVAAIAAAGCSVAIFAAIFGARAFAPFTLLAIALGLGTCAVAWGAAGRGFRWLPWTTAVVADLAALLLVSAWLMERPEAESTEAALWHAAAFGILLALPIGYSVVFGLAVRRGWQRVGPFIAAQTAAAWLVGAGGAWVATRGAPEYRAILGGCMLAAGAAAYAIAFRGLLRTDRRRLHYFATLALLTTTAGTALLLPAPAWLWSPLAVAVAWLGLRHGRVSFSLHAASYTVAAAAASGLLAAGALELGAPTHLPWPSLTVSAVLAWIASLACLALPPPAASAFWGRWRHVPRLILLAVASVGAIAIALSCLALWVPAVAPGPTGDGGMLALARTATLALLAVAAALAGRFRRLAEAGWLVYPLLALGALKVLVEDLPQGRPATLFGSLALYGVALILAPRLRRTVD